MQFNLSKDAGRFFDACDNLTGAKFILADAKITELIGAIADCPQLYNLFDMLTADYDFTEAKEKYLTPSKESDIKGTFTLPDSVGERLVFIFCLLMELDGKKMSLSKFLSCYFYEDGSYFESWYSFCNRVIKPFKSLVRAALDELHPGELEIKSSASRAAKYSAGTYFTGAEEIINGCRELVVADDNLLDGQKKDVLELLDGLAEALLLNDTKQISYIFTGLKYVENKSRSLSEEISRLENLLSEGR